jgi:hypothetical protein
VKPEYVLVAVVTACLTVMSVTPALAAPRQIEEFCFEQARRYVTGDPYRRGTWEAAIANCIADLTPTPTDKRYRKHLRSSTDSRYPAEVSRLVVGELPGAGQELCGSHGDMRIVLKRDVLCE